MARALGLGMTQANKGRRNYARDYVVHAHGLGAQCKKLRARDRVASELLSDVTCKHCLRALEKVAR
jgi:hypothetical protein